MRYSDTVRKLREFFQGEKGFSEVHTQSRLSILAACEDPKTIGTFIWDGTVYPLPQTGQMQLEHELLNNPDEKGFFCISTSYRNEPNPIDGRHEKIFPMFEFESHGGMLDMDWLEIELLEYLDFDVNVNLDYEDIASKYQAEILEAEHEERMQRDYGDVISLQGFPKRTHPFWNMKHAGHGVYNKIDVILYGQETIGSAERSCNVDEMKDQFYTISNGEYADILFKHFGKERVEKELEDYLSLDMIPRFGGGIGVTRMNRALSLKSGDEND